MRTVLLSANLRDADTRALLTTAPDITAGTIVAYLREWRAVTPQRRVGDVHTITEGK